MFRIPRIYVLGLLAVVALIALSMPVLAAGETTKGHIKTVNADKNEFVMADANNKNWNFGLQKDCKVFLNDKAAKLADLQVDDAVTITYVKDGDKLMAQEIRSTRKK